MEDVKLIEKLVVVAETPTIRRRLFLSNIDLTLVTYLETVSFIEKTSNDIDFTDICRSLYRALSRLLVSYDFLAGRADQGENERFEIDCNGAGIVVVAATTSSELSQLGELRGPKPEFKKLVSFLHDEEWTDLELKEKPLLLLQLTRFQCGGLALASLSNHCTLDGVAIRDFIANLASLTRGEDLIIHPNSDRTIFKARNPPRITHPHFEYSRPELSDISFSIRGSTSTTLLIKQPCLLKTTTTTTKLIYLSSDWISNLKTLALKDDELLNCTTFHVLAAKLWKAISIATQLPDECISTVLFPVDIRRKIVPCAPEGFAGNGIIPGFARSNVNRIKTEKFSTLVEEVQKGVERVDDEYVRSGIDWLEVNRGVPCRDNSFSVVVWSRLGLEGEDFGWGRIKFVVPIEVKPGLVFVLPGDKGDQGGINICLELPSAQMEEFYKLMMED
ncbi:Transferase [Macleaya cordata]|uniref:Transferase n=1 Tax=Macleaya cordata TaxID=56857 RepID=A0A200Q8U2_MACCD|nr:Transferase [Macleaya cordata]